MLRCVSPLAATLAAREVIHLPRSDAALVFHTRLKDRIGDRLQRPTNVGALTGSLPLFQKNLAGSVHSVFPVLLFLFLKASSHFLLACGFICRAMAQTKPESSRAKAAITTGAFLRPGPLNCR